MVVNLQWSLALASEISVLLAKKAIRRVSDTCGAGFYSQCFLIPKEDGRHRPSLDCGGQAILPGDWFATIGLEDACFRYLRVLCPPVWDLIGTSHLHKMHGCSAGSLEKGGAARPQLSGWLVGCARSREHCLMDVGRLLWHLQFLGLRLNRKKCQLQPALTAGFLGRLLNTRAGNLSLTKRGHAAIRACLSLFGLGPRVPRTVC